RSDHQRRVNDVAVADDPADVGCRPPDVFRLEAEAPPRHADDMDLIAAMRVNRELGPSRRSRGGQNEGWFVRFHLDVRAALALAFLQKLTPADVAACLHWHRFR